MIKTFTLSASLLSFSLFAQTPDSLVLRPGSEGKDALIFNRNDSQTSNFGNDAHFHAMTWSWDFEDATYRSLLQFDLSSVPAGAVVTSAALTLYADNFVSVNVNGHSKLTHSNASKLYRATQRWDENGVTWANQPPLVAQASAVLAESQSSSQNYTLNVTNDIKSMLEFPFENFGWLLKLDNETTYAGLFFASSDHATAALRPKLVIHYTATTTDLPTTASTVTAFRMYPNPNNSETLHFNKAVSGKIMDMKGNTQLSFSDNSMISIAGLAKGIYMLQTSEGATQKLVVE